MGNTGLKIVDSVIASNPDLHTPEAIATWVEEQLGGGTIKAVCTLAAPFLWREWIDEADHHVSSRRSLSFEYYH